MISKESHTTETIVATLSRDELCDVMRKSATETIKEYGEGDGVITPFLIVVTAHMAAKIEAKIFNNKEDK